MTTNDLAQKIAKTCTLHGEFLLRSGVTSNIYFDKYLFEADPALLREVTHAMVALLPSDVDALAGLEMGGIPIATMLSQHTALFVRKSAKTYGTCKLAEGGDVEGRTLVIIEDVVTSGGQILLSAAELRARGAIIDTVLCAIDRQAGGAESLAKEGLELRPVLKRSDLERS
ncbi:MAG: orotate phosphoribosyltransferase [Verrucomicrobia bacterium]|nr:orotate phosphoribosyltransferase [Verrucomicrobiota bacterium]